jgi:hypothetical protein
MALRDTGQEALTESGTNYLALDGDDRRVTVSASEEALDDYGRPAVWAKAEKKYAANDFKETMSGRLVTVKTTDFDND